MYKQKSQGNFVLSVFFIVTGLTFSPSSYAVECRTIQTVNQSAISSNNNNYGGHLNQHIYGAIPPNSTSQTSKTLFSSIEEYTGFWNNYKNPKKFKGNAVNCSGQSARQKVTVYSVLNKDKIGGYNCTAAGPNGQCTAKTRSKFSNIQLDFKNVGQNWILLTAYPTN